VSKITLTNDSVSTIEDVGVTNGTRRIFSRGTWDPQGKKAYFLGSEYNSSGDRNGKGIGLFDPNSGPTIYHNLTDHSDEYPFNALDAGMMYNTEDKILYFFGGSKLELDDWEFKYVSLDIIAQIDPSTGDHTLSNHVLAHGVGDAVSMWDAQKEVAYILDNQRYLYIETAHWESSPEPRDMGLVTYKPSTGESSYNVIAKSLQMHNSATAFVPELKRIYIFGGHFSDGISYIQL